ncbi:MAG: DUF5522 domain-containing protein [Hyphomicrobiales bacterium]
MDQLNDDNKKSDLYYYENGYMVMTSKFHKLRGYCCGNGCRHCPYHPQHVKGTSTLRDEDYLDRYV